MEDKRFAHIATDPKFKNIRKSDKKVKIDKRFQSMFKDKKFKVNYTVDKRGRTVNKSSNADLRRYYHLSSEEESDSNDSQSENEDLNVNDEDEGVTKNVKQKLKDLNVDYARGESTLFSESSSDDEESDSEVSDIDDKIEHKWGELDADAERTDDVTYRLAACNMDWDRIRAVDLMVLLNSFVPQGGLIKTVSIYPSEFGKERMKEEDLKGPIELVENQENGEKEEENEEGSKYHMEKLRQYQLNRLKYYYAVIVCDSVNTASKIYNECDGMEYESSATKIDLRFIPDDMEFDDEPKEICEKLPDMTKYQPRFFTTTALQQAKVDLTWDETNPDRVEITQKLAKGKLDEIAKEDLENYLASSSEDEENNELESDDVEDGDDDEENKDPIDKYRALLSDIENKEKEKDKKDVQMEITWGIDLEEKTQKLAKKKLEEKTEKTPFQKYLDKRKEKRKEKKERKKVNSQDSNEDISNSESDDDIPSDIDMNDPYFKEEFDKPEFKKKSQKKSKSIQNDEIKKQNNGDLELLLMDEDDTKRHFNLKKIQDDENESKSKKKRNKKRNDKSDKSDDFEINVEDERFSALYTSHHFNIDPSDPHYKKTKGMEKIINEKLKRRKEENCDDNDSKKVKKESAELNVLIKSVKRKAEALKNKKK